LKNQLEYFKKFFEEIAKNKLDFTPQKFKQKIHPTENLIIFQIVTLMKGSEVTIFPPPVHFPTPRRCLTGGSFVTSPEAFYEKKSEHFQRSGNYTPHT